MANLVALVVIGLFCGLVSVADAAPRSARIAKAEAARLSGAWVVERGEFLLRICRSLIPDSPVRQRQCVRDFVHDNPQVLRPGKPDKMAAGTRLAIPAALRTAADAAGPCADAAAATAPATAMAAGVEAPRPLTPPSAPVTTSVANAARPVAAATPARTEYRDQLIGGNMAPDRDDADGEQSRLDGMTPGQRFVSVEFLRDTKDELGRGRGSEHALNVRYRRETENWGEWVFDVAARRLDAPPGTRAPAAGNTPRVTLTHNLFPLTEQWVANSIIGVVRSPLNPLVTNSFRLSLPTPLYMGVATNIGDGQRELRFAAGQIGTLSGLAASAFGRTAGSFASIGGNLRLAERWSVGAQAINVREAANVVDHTSVAGVLRYHLPQLVGGATLHAVTDGLGRTGFWSDADIKRDSTRNQFGVYRLDPGLAWADTQIANDQQGLYWRINRAGLRQFWSGGLSYDDTNIRREPSRGGQESISGYFGNTLRLDRRLSVGGTLSIQSTRPRAANTPARRTFSGNMFVNATHLLGVTRIDAARYLLRAEAFPQDTVDTFSLTHDWPSIGDYAISSALSGSRENSAGSDTRRESANLSLRSPPGADLHWDLAVAIARVANIRGVEKNINASLSGFWRISEDITASAQFIWSTIDPAPPLPGVTLNPFRREKRIALTLQYEQASGSALGSTTPNQARRYGTGRITGVVFFDENGDGLRQANERGAGNLTVFLDGRIPATTDTNGRYVFSSVPTGLRSLLMSTDMLPLPWTLEQETGFKVTVPLRGEVVLDIPLIRLNR